MLAHSLRRLLPISATCLPYNFHNSTDLAFYFPRFQPRTHVQAMGIPELRDAIALLQPETEEIHPKLPWSTSYFRPDESARGEDSEDHFFNYKTRPRFKNPLSRFPAPPPQTWAELQTWLQDRERALSLLERGIDILESIGGLQQPGIAPSLRAVYALRFELWDGTAHLPRPAAARRCHVQRRICGDAIRLLRDADVAWDRAEVAQLDVLCVVLAHFVKSFAMLYPRPFHSNGVDCSGHTKSNTSMDNTAAAPKTASVKLKFKSSASATVGNAAGADSNSSGSPPATSNKSMRDSTAASSNSGLRAVKLSDPATTTNTHNTTNNNSHHENNSTATPLTDNNKNNIPNILLPHTDPAETISPETALQLASDRLEELLRVAEAAARQPRACELGLDWIPVKLLVLRALLRLGHTNNLLLAEQDVHAALRRVEQLQKPLHPLVEARQGRTEPAEGGLLLLLQAELHARMSNWEGLNPGEVDAGVLRRFETAAAFYESTLDDLNLENLTDPNHRVTTVQAETLQRRWFEVQACGTCWMSQAVFLLGAPRPMNMGGKLTSGAGGLPIKETPVFLPQQLFDLHPVRILAPPSSASSSWMSGVFPQDCERAPLSLESCRRRTGQLFERALALNRALWANNNNNNINYRMNPQAAWLLLGMGALYADARDYLYATGLFESAAKAVEENYGVTSLEAVMVQKLRYEFLAGVGSTQEAKAAAHTVVRLLKALDAMP